MYRTAHPKYAFPRLQNLKNETKVVKYKNAKKFNTKYCGENCFHRIKQISIN